MPRAAALSKFLTAILNSACNLSAGPALAANTFLICVLRALLVARLRKRRLIFLRSCFLALLVCGIVFPLHQQPSDFGFFRKGSVLRSQGFSRRFSQSPP